MIKLLEQRADEKLRDVHRAMLSGEQQSPLGAGNDGARLGGRPAYSVMARKVTRSRLQRTDLLLLLGEIRKCCLCINCTRIV
jgi:hypothetical protein